MGQSSPASEAYCIARRDRKHLTIKPYLPLPLYNENELVFNTRGKGYALLTVEIKSLFTYGRVDLETKQYEITGHFNYNRSTAYLTNGLPVEQPPSYIQTVRRDQSPEKEKLHRQIARHHQ